MVKASTYTVTALEDKVGMRVDRYLADAIEGLSRSRIQVLIAAGWVTVDGAVLGNASAKVRAGQRFHVDVPAAEPPRLVAEEIPLTVVYEDADVIGEATGDGVIGERAVLALLHLDRTAAIDPSPWFRGDGTRH